MGSEFNSVRLDLPNLRQAEDLKAPTVGQDWQVPIHEAVQSSSGVDDIQSGANGEMVRVPQKNLRPHFEEFARIKRLDAGLSSHRHEDRRVDGAAHCLQAAETRP